MRPRRPRGFALVSAIFLLVALAALGGFIAAVSTSQHVASALDVMGARAYQAARAGTEWGLYRALHDSSCSAVTEIGTLETMAVTVNCTSVAAGSAKEAGLGTIYSITATACNMPAAATPFCPGHAGNANYVERRVTVLAER